MKVYKVCIAHTAKDAFDYLAGTQRPSVGARVWVPFRNSLRVGIIVGEAFCDKVTDKLKSIERLIDQKPILTAELFTLCTWISAYYQAPLSEVIPLALPKNYRLGKEQSLLLTDFYTLRLSKEEAFAIVPSRAVKMQQFIDFLASSEQKLTKKQILDAGFSRAQIDKLINLHILQHLPEPALPVVAANPVNAPLLLNSEQALAVETISAAFSHYQCFLLQGVTGSGKTEVYLQLVAKALTMGRQILILVPEIGLTPQLLARFTERFNTAMAIVHSNLNPSERQQAWQLAKEGIVKLIIGTRAAVFTPMPQLGLIIIDEEHDTSLKQMEGVRYSARDTALMRAHALNIPIVLGSATPSLESLHNCQLQKYQLLRLHQKAMASTPLHYQLIDIRNQNLQQGFAPSVLKTIKTHLENQTQVLVFINRRGFAPVLLCHLCGWIADCKACDSHLTLHRQLNQLLCHHCGSCESLFKQCKACKSTELVPVGLGTQRVFDFLNSQFPNVSHLRVDRDTITTKHGLEEQLTRIHQGDVQLIVGTQMLAKGHHFPRLTLSVILDADTGFFNQDFRALENLGQLLTQVAGRAGRAELPGQVLIQTHIPQHPLLNILMSEGYDAFANALLLSRKNAQLPPFHFLALIRASSKNQAKLLQSLHKIKEQLNEDCLTVMGPAPAPLARKAHQHRMQLLIKASSRKKLQLALTNLRTWLTMNTQITNGLRWNIDVDPMDLL